MNRSFATCICALVALNLTVSAQAPPARATGDQRRQYVFAPTGQQMPYRVYVPKTWDGKVSLPIILMLHGAGANEGTYLDQADGLLMKLAEQHGYIVVSPLGFSPLGAYGNPLRLPAVFGQTAAAASQRAAVTPARQRELNLSEFEVMTALEIVTEEYGADRSRTYLAGHSMGSGGAWHLAARYPERWRAVAPMSGPFVDEATYPFDRIRRLPIFMTEGTGATPSLEGSRVLARYMRERGFAFEYLEVDGNHGSMVPMVWPRIFEFFNRQGQAPAPPPSATGPIASDAVAQAPQEIRLWPGKAPGSERWTVPEATTTSPSGDRTITNVSDPTVTVFLPAAESATGTAVVVAPGGALRLLGWDNEGVKVAQWLNTKGIAALVLKYRTLQTMPASGRGRGAPPPGLGVAGAGPRKELEIRNGNANPEPDDPALREVLHMGIADAQQALRLARQNASGLADRSRARRHHGVFCRRWHCRRDVTGRAFGRVAGLPRLALRALTAGRQRARARAAALRRRRFITFQRDQRLPGTVRCVEGRGQARRDPCLRSGQRRLRDDEARAAG